MMEHEILPPATSINVASNNEASASVLSLRLPSGPLVAVPEKMKGLLVRMFADPYLLEKSERADLAAQLRRCVAANPEVSDLRVLLGMALCVNFEVADAIEELRESVRLAPNSYIANLKMGELWMRLRVMDKAEEHTQCAGRLATNMAQSELARRQASSIRAMKHAGIERGGYKSPWTILSRLIRRFWKQQPSQVIPVTLDPVDVN
jgi:hypothetical protein